MKHTIHMGMVAIGHAMVHGGHVTVLGFIGFGLITIGVIELAGSVHRFVKGKK